MKNKTLLRSTRKTQGPAFFVGGSTLSIPPSASTPGLFVGRTRGGQSLCPPSLRVPGYEGLLRNPFLLQTQPQVLFAQLSASPGHPAPQPRPRSSWVLNEDGPHRHQAAADGTSILLRTEPALAVTTVFPTLFCGISQKRVVLSPHSNSLTPSWPRLLDYPVLPNISRVVT